MFYGGAAGGGKTDLLLGAALTCHRASIIFRREYRQHRGIIERSRELIGTSGRLNEQTSIWRVGQMLTIELGAVKDEDDKESFQGRPHDLVAFDEVTHFTESQVRYLMGWNRTTIRGQRTRMIATGNPPRSTEGQWVIDYWAPWLDETHERPAEPGELRWFAVLGGKDIEVDGPEPFEHDGEMIYPKSRTFIPARLTDNPYLTTDANYIATLQGLQEPLRTQVLYGDFSVGLIVDASQLIRNEWLRAAKALEASYAQDGGPLVAGLDIAGPGEDETVCYVRQGANLLASTVSDEPDPLEAVLDFLRPFVQQGLTQVNADSAGIGLNFCPRLKDRLPESVHINPVNVGKGAETDALKENYANLRSQLFWALRERFEAGAIAGLTDQVCINQLASIRYKHDLRYRVVIESKDDARKRGVKSPDRADALMLCFAPQLRGQRLAGAFQAAAKRREW